MSLWTDQNFLASVNIVPDLEIREDTPRERTVASCLVGVATITGLIIGAWAMVIGIGWGISLLVGNRLG